MFKKVNMIDVSDFDQLVEDTYGKIYSFQQQDGFLYNNTEIGKSRITPF